MAVQRVTIRQIASDEIDVFRSIRLEALRYEPASFASRFEDWQFLPNEEWRRRLDDPVIVAFSNDEPVGIMGLVRFRPRKMAHRATLISVYVRKSERGTGLASKLLRVTMDHATQLGVLQMELTVNAENSAALRFYQHHGFVEVGRIPGGVLDGVKEIDDIIMVRRLDG
ncbi:GNAT family N-acetyltransferase [Rhizobium sp. P38BS-XIX]|uniref:GNAT family N-acetyltransferase n=1 Tax=Rhizobium sp. P38BS-XIX TaxID=2726740 RepID=UPI0014572265|nr:GNAT family N-acetyltransferase [Rhizobium sp. P38BS-XIX]NLR97327.1 GNAT family N-acetyltransferase [Rhizobium sp. P38BS-XIX]